MPMNPHSSVFVGITLLLYCLAQAEETSCPSDLQEICDRFCNTTLLLRQIKLLSVRQKYQTAVFRHNSASGDIQTQSLVCHGANCSLLLCQRPALALPGSTLKALTSYPGIIYSRLNTRESSQQSISGSAEQKETTLLLFLFLLHILRCSNTTKQARSAPPLLLAWSASRSQRSGL